MRKNTILTALLLMVAGFQTAVAQKMIVTLDDNSKVEYDIKRVKDVTFVESDEHESVDLGLPSGTLWATCNVGANSPEQYGDHFAWGETVQRDDYTPSAYTYNDLTTITAYDAQSNDTCLLPEYDAATANWGGDWQMPTAKQFEELINDTYTTKEWTTQNGVNGYKITSRSNGKSIFLPAAGFYMDGRSHEMGVGGYYWSRSRFEWGEALAYFMTFQQPDVVTAQNLLNRCCGMTIRPVCTPGVNQ